MKTVLAIDTSTSQTSVALIQDGKVLFNASHNDPLAHGEVLPKLVSQALVVNSKVDLVAVGMGPGPFTVMPGVKKDFGLDIKMVFRSRNLR